MGTLGLEIVQRGRVMGTLGADSSDSAEGLDELETNFCNLYPNLFTRIGKIRKSKLRAEIVDALKPKQQKNVAGYQSATKIKWTKK